MERAVEQREFNAMPVMPSKYELLCFVYVQLILSHTNNFVPSES